MHIPRLSGSGSLIAVSWQSALSTATCQAPTVAVAGGSVGVTGAVEVVEESRCLHAGVVGLGVFVVPSPSRVVNEHAVETSLDEGARAQEPGSSASGSGRCGCALAFPYSKYRPFGLHIDDAGSCAGSSRVQLWSAISGTHECRAET